MKKKREAGNLGRSTTPRSATSAKERGGLTALPVGERSTGHMPRPAAVAADGEERSEIPDDEAPFVAPDIDDEIEPSPFLDARTEFARNRKVLDGLSRGCMVEFPIFDEAWGVAGYGFGTVSPIADHSMYLLCSFFKMIFLFCSCFFQNSMNKRKTASIRSCWPRYNGLSLRKEGRCRSGFS